MEDIVKRMNEQQDTIERLNEENEQLQEKVKKLESILAIENILADNIVRRYEIKDAWKQRIEKRW